MTTIISIIQLITAVALIIMVLLQDSGSGVGESFGGGGGAGGVSTQRRGLENVMHIATIIGLIIFAATSLALLLL